MKTEAHSPAGTQTGGSQVPPSDLADASVPASPPAITTTMVDSLRQTKPWVRFLSILGFVMAGLMMLVGFVCQLLGIVASMSPPSRLKSPLSAPAMILIGLAYMGLAVLYFLPALYLYRFAEAIKRLPALDGASGMEEALRHQELFWRFAVVAILGTLVFYALALIGGFYGAAFEWFLRR